MNSERSMTEQEDLILMARMRAHVTDLMARSPWYARKFREMGIDVASLRTRDDLYALPLTTKEELAAHHDTFRCVPMNRIVDHVATSGSTGKPVPYLLSEKDLDRLARNEAASLAVAGVTSDDIVQITTTLDKRFMAGLAYWLGLRRLGAGVIRTGPGNPLGQWETIDRCGTTVIIVVPSFLLRMLEERERAGLQHMGGTLQKAICIGEPISAPGGGPNLLAQRVQAFCTIDLYGTYASTEMATACTEAVPFGGHVVPHDLAHIEVLDDAGQPVPEGTIGEVVATPWGVEAMPLLRFRTGDLCTWHMEKRADGSWKRLLGPIVGRKAQRMKVKGTTLFPQQVLDALHAEPDVRSFVVLRETDDLGGDVVRVLLDAPTDDLNALHDRLRDKLRVAVLLERTTPAAIDALRNDPLKRKSTPFVDRTSSN